MASSVDIIPALGHGLIASQVGPSAGYDAIDVRRLAGAMRSEGVLSTGSYAVTQRAAGANMTVDVAASTGNGALVQGDSVTAQGIYYVAPHTAVINVDIAAANASNPRLDIVILEIKDDQHDVGGLNVPRVRVVSGTATSGATLVNRSGAPALPSSALHLADVLVAASDTSITNAEIGDRRVMATTTPATFKAGYGGKCIIATEEARTNTAYGTLTTPDVVTGVVLPTDGLICVAYQAMWKESVAASARAAIFVGANQLKVADSSAANPGVVVAEAGTSSASTGIYKPLTSIATGLVGLGDTATAYTGDVTTGQAVATRDSLGNRLGGCCMIFAAAGTYDISIQFKAGSGSVTAKNRNLWVWTQAFG